MTINGLVTINRTRNTVLDTMKRHRRIIPQSGQQFILFLESHI